GPGQVTGCTRIADERAHLVAAPGERAREMATREPGGAGYEDAHRSATIETGEPNRRSRPARSSRRSTDSVKRREPMALCSAMGRTNWRCTARIAKPPREKTSAISASVNTRYGSVRLPSAWAARRTIDSSAAKLVADG